MSSSRTVSLSGNRVSWSVTPIRSRIAVSSVAQCSPRTSTAPDVGWFSPSRISTVVVLPAPLGPRSPKHSPTEISRSIPLTAWTGPSRPGYCLRNSLTRMTRSLMEGVSPVWLEFSLSRYSDHDAVADDGRLGDDGHTVTDHVSTRLLRVNDAGVVDHPDVAADSSVLVDDGSLDHRAGANARARPPLPLVLGDLVRLLVVVDAHQVSITDGGVLADDRTDADDGVLDHHSSPDDAAVADQTVLHGGTAQSGARQITRPGKDRLLTESEIERRDVARQIDVGLMKGAHGADVFPVAVEKVGLDPVVGERLRQDLVAKVGGVARFEQLDQGPGVEQVDAHAGQVRAAAGLQAQFFQPGSIRPDTVELLLGLGLLLEVDHPAVGLDAHDTARPRFGFGNGQCGNGDNRLVLDVGPDHVLEIHPVKLVSRKNQHIVRGFVSEIGDVLAHGVGGALVPRLVLHCLLRGEDLHETPGERIKLVRVVNMSMQAHGVELRENEDAVQTGVDAVGYGNIDESIFPGDRHGWLAS